MLSMVGAVNVGSIGASGVVRFGDSYRVSPEITHKTSAGAGAFNTGDFITVDTISSVTNVNDADISDQNNIGNA